MWIIEIILNNYNNYIKSVFVLTPTCSHHSPVSIEITFKILKQDSFQWQIRDCKRADHDGLKNQFIGTDWDDVISVEISFNILKQNSFKRQIRDFTRADYDVLNHQLIGTDWDGVVFISNNIYYIDVTFVKPF